MAHDPSTPQQADPLSPLAENAAAMHEMFTSLVEGGFAERQALVLIAEMVTARGERE